MSNTKIFGANQGISKTDVVGTTVTELPSNVDSALALKDPEGHTYVQIDTDTDGRKVIIAADNNADGSVGQNWQFLDDRKFSPNASGTVFLNTQDPTSTNPVMGPRRGDEDTGIGSNAADELSLIAGGMEKIRAATSTVTIIGNGGTTGDAAPTGASAPTLYLESSTGNSQDRCTLLMNADGPSGSNLDMNYGGNRKLLITAQDATQSITFEDDLKIKNEATDAAVLAIANSGVDVIGGFAGTGSGTVGTGGSSSTTLEQASASTFQTELHVGAAIKITNPSTGAVTLRTVASITDANTLEMDEAATLPAGCSWKYDSGELFAVKTGDSKTLFAVDGTGAIQVGSAAADSSANNNIAIGDSDALDTIEQSGTNGIKNIIIGHADDNYKLTTGYSHVFIGYDAGTDVTTGHQCVAIGDIAMGAAQAGANLTTAIGRKAGYSAGNTGTYVGAYAGEAVTGYSNVAVGYSSMNLNGPDNGVAVGRSAHASCTGDQNVAVGAYSLDASGAAGKAAAVGYDSLGACTGIKNTALGYEAGNAITDGTENICIGHQSDAGASNVKVIAIGNQVAGTTNQRAYIGDGSNQSTLDFSGASNSWTATSDSRIKENVQDGDLGLDFINSLRTVKYTEVNPADWPEEIRSHIYTDRERTRRNEEGEKETYIEPASERPETNTQVFDGLIAQEVIAAAAAAGSTFSGIDDGESNGLLRLQYERMVIPLIKAVQELSLKVKALEEQGN
jgi:hypothetical protein